MIMYGDPGCNCIFRPFDECGGTLFHDFMPGNDYPVFHKIGARHAGSHVKEGTEIARVCLIIPSCAEGRDFIGIVPLNPETISGVPRLADNSSLTMISPDLANLIVRLDKGRAIGLAFILCPCRWHFLEPIRLGILLADRGVSISVFFLWPTIRMRSANTTIHMGTGSPDAVSAREDAGFFAKTRSDRGSRPKTTSERQMRKKHYEIDIGIDEADRNPYICRAGQTFG